MTEHACFGKYPMLNADVRERYVYCTCTHSRTLCRINEIIEATIARNSPHALMTSLTSRVLRSRMRYVSAGMRFGKKVLNKSLDCAFWTPLSNFYLKKASQKQIYYIYKQAALEKIESHFRMSLVWRNIIYVSIVIFTYRCIKKNFMFLIFNCST